MRMPSEESSYRREPRQPRAERRVAELLKIAGAVLAENGYESATMTEIAERAGTSIGTVYQYFPNKQAVVLALQNQYATTMDERWAEVEEAAGRLSMEEIAHRLVEITSRFVEEHPALFLVLDAPLKQGRSTQRRVRLRERMARVLQSKAPELPWEVAYRMANVSVQTVKGMTVLYAGAGSEERGELIAEYRLILAGYLVSRVSEHGAAGRSVAL